MADRLAHARDLARGLALPESRHDRFGRDDPVGHPDLGQVALEGQEHAVGDAVADLAALGVVERNRPWIELLEVLGQRFADTGHEAHDLVPGAAILHGLDVIAANDGPGTAVFADDQRRVPGQLRRPDVHQRRITVDLGLADKRDPAVDVELAEQSFRLIDLFVDEHQTPPVSGLRRPMPTLPARSHPLASKSASGVTIEMHA